MKRNISVFLGLFGVSVFYYWGLWKTYFVQDEWNGFGVVINMAHQPFSSWFNISTSLHFFPLNIFSWLSMYRIFGYNSFYYGWASLLLHVVAAFLVYVLARKLSKSTWIGLLTSLLFLTNSKARAAVTYLGVFLNTLPFFIFVILFFIYLATLIKKTKYGFKEAFVLFFLFLCAVLFREEAVILMLLMPIFLLIYRRQALSVKNLRFFITFYVASVCFLVYRIAIQLTGKNADSISNESFFKTYIYNAATFPYKLLVQNILDGYFQVQLFLINHPKIPLSLDAALFLLFVFIGGIILFVLVKSKNMTFRRNVYFSLVLILLNGLILATIGRTMIRVEERYLYLSGFAVAFLLSLIVSRIFSLKKNTYVFLPLKIVTAVALIILFVNSYVVIQHEIQTFVKQGEARRKIITQIKKLHPAISKNTIFYVTCRSECARNGEFGLSNNIVLPFSSGPGWILMLQYAKDNETGYAPFFKRYKGHGIVWYWQEQKFKDVPVREFLWDMGSQGYREIGEYGFGYFTDLNLLQQTIQKEKFNKKNVIGLEYDEKTFIIRDVSKSIQEKL